MNPETTAENRPAAPNAAPAATTNEVKCADCGQNANVPFTPDSSRPVYCRDCFAKRRNSAGGPGGRGGPRGGGGGRFGRGPFVQRESKMAGVTNGYSRHDYPGYNK